MTTEVTSILSVKINRSKKNLKSKNLKYKSNLSLNKAIVACQTAFEKKGDNIILLDVSKLTIISDYFLIITANSKPHLQTLGRHIEEAIKIKLNETIVFKEGITENVWTVLDFGDLIVHIMLEEERNYYKLESFWRNAIVIDNKLWEKAS